jgi:hypothetical protein
MTDYRNDPQVLDVVRKVRAMRLLTIQTGCFTKKSQGMLLQALDPERLASAAEILTQELTKEERQTNANPQYSQQK